MPLELWGVLAEMFKGMGEPPPPEVVVKYGVFEGFPEHLAGMQGDKMHKLSLLNMTLGCMVPLMMMEIQRDRWSWGRICNTAHECGQVVAEKGDIILFKQKATPSHPIGTAEAVGFLARGIACLSHAQGGVKVFGYRYEATYRPNGSL